MFFLYTAMTCSLKLSISKCDQFLEWQKPIKLFQNIDCMWAARTASFVPADLKRSLLWLAGKQVAGAEWG